MKNIFGGMSVKGEGGYPPQSVTFFFAKKLSVKGGVGTPLTDKIRNVIFDPFPRVDVVGVLPTGSGKTLVQW